MRVLFALLALAASVATVSAQGWTGPNFYIINATIPTSFNFLIDGVVYPDPSFNFTVGTTYKFFLNASFGTTHPFGFSSSDQAIAIEDFSAPAKGGVTTSGACTNVTAGTGFAWYTTSGSETTNPCVISITPPANITGFNLFYRCSVHSQMIGTLTAVAAAGTATTAPPTTPAPSGNSTTAPPTTTPAPAGSSSSTGKGNGAAVLVPGAAVFLIAAINALFV